jgi:hypothetical protein
MPIDMQKEIEKIKERVKSKYDDQIANIKKRMEDEISREMEMLRKKNPDSVVVNMGEGEQGLDAIVTSFIEKSGKDRDYVKSKLVDIEKQAEKKFKEKNEDYYSYVVGVLKKVLGIKEETITTASAGNISQYGGSGNFAPKMSGELGMMTRYGKLEKKKNKKMKENFIKYIDGLMKG